MDGLSANPKTNNLDFRAFDSINSLILTQVHREFPINLQSVILSLRIRSVRIDRTRGLTVPAPNESAGRSELAQPQCIFFRTLRYICTFQDQYSSIIIIETKHWTLNKQ